MNIVADTIFFWPRLYRYEKCEEKRILSLEEGKLWMALPETFNDIFDCDLKIKKSSFFGFPELKIKEAAKVFYEEFGATPCIPQLMDDATLESIKLWVAGSNTKNHILDSIMCSIKKRIKGFGIQCFAKSNLNQLLWSNYASHHTGFCIEYAFGHMTLIMDNPYKFAMYPVSYQSYLPEITLNEILFSPDITLQRLVATKSSDWAYEDEHRLIYFDCKPENNDKGENINLPKGLEIKSIFIGKNTKPEDEEALRKIADKLEIATYKMKLSNDSYTLEAEEYR